MAEAARSDVADHNARRDIAVIEQRLTGIDDAISRVAKGVESLGDALRDHMASEDGENIQIHARLKAIEDYQLADMTDRKTRQAMLDKREKAWFRNVRAVDLVFSALAIALGYAGLKGILW